MGVVDLRKEKKAKHNSPKIVRWGITKLPKSIFGFGAKSNNFAFSFTPK